MQIKSAADLRAFIKGFYDQHVTALNGILEKLPEPLKGELSKLRDGLNTALEKLPPLDQAPASQDASWAFNSFAEAWSRMAEYSDGLRQRLASIAGELQTKALALNSLEQKITAGEYISKEKAAEAANLARTEGANSMLPEILATRKSALELAGLPVPPDNILHLPGKDYETRVTAAKDQVGRLNAKGLKLGGKGSAWVTSMAWLGATEFNGQMTALEEVLGTTTTAPAKTGDPLLGTAPTDNNNKPAQPALTLV
ncbi:MAG TPA: hypothetical protein VMU04_10150 [Candidatus Acidoferrum sp.]|nr:hypothetical protein [Candidatus Acidoferrum sp.]